jgi:pSer/pThr/pTyr-binding forkhead associated (FHA) protein
MVDLPERNIPGIQNERVRTDQPRNPTTGEAMPSKAQSTPASSPPVPTGDETPGESTTVHDMVSTDTTMNFSQEFAAQIASIDSNVTAEEQESIAALPSGSALMVVRRGPNAGARFLLDADLTSVGRHPNADIFLDDVTVSRRHAEFLRTGTAFTVKDLGSLNGTYFDGERIETAALTDGAEVQVGKFRLTFYASRLDLARAASE